MSKRSKPETVRQGVDPQSQQHIDRMRAMAGGAADVALGHGNPFFLGSDAAGSIDDFMNPFIGQVVDATRGEFDHLRGQAVRGADQQATMSGAFGGSRHGIMAGARLGEIDRAQGTAVANLMQQGFGQAVGRREHERQLMERMAQEPLFRQQNALQFMNLGMGPVGSNVQQDTRRNLLGSTAGGALTGFGVGGPLGAVVGGGLGLLGGLFG